MKKLKKVLFILHAPPPVHGSSMVGGFIRNSTRVNTVFNARYINLGTSKNIDEIGKGGFQKVLRYLNILFKVLKQLVIFKPNVCYLAISAKGAAFYKDALVALVIKSLGFKIIYHFHNKGVSENQGKRFDDLLYSWVFRNTYAILLSQHLYYDIKKYFSKNRVFYCPNGIPKLKKNDLKFRIKNNNDSIQLLFLSNLIESKGVFILLDALKILKETTQSFNCVFVGGEGDVSEHQFNEYVKKLELSDHVQYLGKKYGSDKNEVFLAADIFIFPTFYHNETFGLVNLEAMQYSLPVISTPEGGIPDVIDDGESGFLVPQKDTKALAEKIEQLIKDPILRMTMGAKGNRKYEKEFTLSIFETRLVNILSKVVL
ncbi:glycosyltransferase family 4 protein [Leeuwenhoekiella aequorea]|uniref:glycosyltransferase family 4 protein n=1 Tax=Leeuwenhoekiella aequorea TaxID=283736 RepID=UPI00352C661D|tara:strand:- start:3688 stop:4800 length:1113 start_codon:yes stop_codon:yes gene_type:complete